MENLETCGNIILSKTFGKGYSLRGIFHHLITGLALRILNLMGHIILPSDDLVLLIALEEMTYICLIHQTRYGRNCPVLAKWSQMEVIIACQKRSGVVISSLTMAIYINGEATNTKPSLVCIAMILQLRLGRNLRLMIMVSHSHTPILVQSWRMEIGYSSQDGMAFAF